MVEIELSFSEKHLKKYSGLTASTIDNKIVILGVDSSKEGSANGTVLRLRSWQLPFPTSRNLENWNKKESEFRDSFLKALGAEPHLLEIELGDD